MEEISGERNVQVPQRPQGHFSQHAVAPEPLGHGPSQSSNGQDELVALDRTIHRSRHCRQPLCQHQGAGIGTVRPQIRQDGRTALLKRDAKCPIIITMLTTVHDRNNITRQQKSLRACPRSRHSTGLPHARGGTSSLTLYGPGPPVLPGRLSQAYCAAPGTRPSHHTRETF